MTALSYALGDLGDGGLKRLRCVIESVTVKYTMFDRLGTPLRAFANVKVREAHLQAQDVEGADRAQTNALKQRMAERDRDR